MAHLPRFVDPATRLFNLSRQYKGNVSNNISNVSDTITYQMNHPLPRSQTPAISGSVQGSYLSPRLCARLFVWGKQKHKLESHDIGFVYCLLLKYVAGMSFSLLLKRKKSWPQTALKYKSLSSSSQS